MEAEQKMHKIQSINCKRILNSHLGFTNEFVIELENGNTVTGLSPLGPPTIGIYEDKDTRSDNPQKMIEDIGGPCGGYSLTKIRL